MVFFLLAFAAGYLITKATAGFANGGKAVSGEKTDAAVGRATERDKNDSAAAVPPRLPPRGRVAAATNPGWRLCRFSNHYNNCWLNATLQAVLNVDRVKTKVGRQEPRLLRLTSPFPATACLFLTALHNPGREFSSADIFPALVELSEQVPSLQLSTQNDVTDFVEPFASWLDDCGVDLKLEVHTIGRCGGCGRLRRSRSSFSSICYLPPPCEGDFITSLFHTMAYDTGSGQLCDVCRSHLTSEVYFNDPDVMLLDIPRTPNSLQPRLPVSTSACLLVPVGNGMTTYRLASVVCHRTLSSSCDHFYTYVYREGEVLKADDRGVSEGGKAFEDDISRNGLIYLYEKVS